MPRVLIVEDDENLRDMLQEWLIFEKYTVVSCGSGREAIEQLQLLVFDVILMDWHLTDMTGIEILKTFRGAGGKAPVLLLSGSTTQAEKQQALEAGASCYLTKPFKLAELSANLSLLVSLNDK